MDKKMIYTEPEMEICFWRDSTIYTSNSNTNAPYETEDDLLWG